jgi:hypothetical protein
MSEALKEEREAARSGTVPQRRAYTDGRREAASERDSARFRLAEQPGEVEIPHDRGYLQVFPPTFDDLTAPILEHANGLIDSIGHDALLASGAKGGFIARGFLPDEMLEPGSPYMRLALSERVVQPIAHYLGVVPVLTDIDVWYSAHHPKKPKSSQLWHLDHADTTQVKLWLYLGEVGHETGPLTMVDAGRSDEIADENDYNFGESYRLPDDRISEGEVVELTGPAGTVNFTDTSRCFHMGSRVAEGAAPRRACVFQYLTPYSFKFADHREQAPLRRLGGTSELERLVLGAA